MGLFLPSLVLVLLLGSVINAVITETKESTLNAPRLEFCRERSHIWKKEDCVVMCGSHEDDKGCDRYCKEDCEKVDCDTNTDLNCPAGGQNVLGEIEDKEANTRTNIKQGSKPERKYKIKVLSSTVFRFTVPIALLSFFFGTTYCILHRRYQQSAEKPEPRPRLVNGATVPQAEGLNQNP